jgi:HD-GYP domain-containing protein (c-di-GMP phosphodiesterase class II)
VRLDRYDDPAAEALLRACEERAYESTSRRERRVEAMAGLGFVLCALALALLAPWSTPLSLPALAACSVAYLAVSRVSFTVSDGTTAPTQIVFLPMLFALPTPLVPLLVALLGLVTRIAESKLDGTNTRRSLMAFGDSWYALGPALVLVLADAQQFAWDRWPVYVVAIAAQLLLDATSALLRGWLIERVSPLTQLRLLSWIYLVDVELSAVGLLAAFAAASRPGLVLLCLPLAATFSLFARERRERLSHAMELSSAYQGTALLLGTVVEADDAYTGSHSRDVLDLALDVADQLGLDARRRRNVEFGALLHDVGKVRVPKEIVNKPGPLDDAEWAVMHQHTLWGEQMLLQVGGVLAEVGRVIRSSHEHVDGSGYPDGLRDDEIPIESRIITACDAFSAMTTDRSYRRARPAAAALGELWRCAGTQFDTQVVHALSAVVTRTPVDGAPSARPATPLAVAS